MFALGFYDPEGGYVHGCWSIEFITDDFDEAVENLLDAREDAAAGNYHWYGSRLMLWVQTPSGPRWQELLESATEDTQ